MYGYEVLHCETCGKLWNRQIQRGRKPRICEECRYWGYKPAPVKRITQTTAALILTDGGRKNEGIPWESSDCTVRALATATGRPYSEAYAFMAANGRKKGKGAYFNQALYRNKNLVLGHKFTSPNVFHRARGIKTTLQRNPYLRYGTWILQMQGHVATLKNGVLLDSFDSTRKEVRGAWQVTPA